MNLKIIAVITLFTISLTATGQSDSSVNRTDASGMKQGHWIKRYPDKTILYDGYFKDNHPVGEFRRYYKNGSLNSVLEFSNDGRTAIATLYHPNGNIASKGKYVDRKKEGKWQFFSEMTKGYLISEDLYTKDIRNGLSLKYYPDSTVAEKVTYINGVKQGEWTRYYPGGALLLKSGYVNGKIDGKFQTWFKNGKIQFSGQYKNDSREGQWLIYNPDGTVKYRLEYSDGITNNRQMDIDEAKILDQMEKNKDNVVDPEKSGIMK